MGNNAPRWWSIRTAMMLRGISGADIARELGVSRSCVNQVIRGTMKSRRVMAAVATALGREFGEVWSSEQ